MDKLFSRSGFLGGVLLLSAVLVGLASYAVYRYTIQTVQATYTASLRTETESFELALQHAFIIQDWELVENLLQDLSRQSTVDTIRVLDSRGTVVASSIPEESGITLDPLGRNCSLCHAAGADPLPLMAEVTSEDEAQRRILIANSLDNRVVCQGCHAGSQETLGLILAAYDGTNQGLLQRNTALAIALGGGGLWLLFVLALGLPLQVGLFKPIESLARGRSDRGLLERRDGLGEAARRTQELRQELALQDRLADSQRAHINALLSISATIEESITVESLFRKAIGTLQEVTGFTSIAMRHYDAADECFRLVYQSGLSPKMVKELASIPASAGYHEEIFRTRRAVISTDLAHDPRRQSEAPIEVGYQSLISIPFLSGDRIMGSMELASRTPQTFPAEQVRWLELVGRVIGNIMHHIELAGRLQGAAILRERNFLAQEIHDGLVQLLGSLRLWAEHALLEFESGDYDQVQDIIRKIEANARDAYSSLREEMLGLRETFLPQGGLLQVLREYLVRYQRQWGIETRLTADRAAEDGMTRFPSPMVEIQLLRIIQEGLNNVRRHARASQVHVRLSSLDGSFRVEIIDDGTGFEPGNVGPEKLGLQIMRERVGSIDGRLQIDSSPEAGTRLCVEVPLPRPPDS